MEAAVTDIVTPSERSRMMSRIRGRDTAPERLVRSALHRAGFRFRLHAPELPGKPDLVLPRRRAVILVHGCFWHRHPGCAFAYEPKSRVRFWTEKFRRNVERDAEQTRALKAAGWRVLTVWECGLRSVAHRDRLLIEICRWAVEATRSQTLPRRPVRGNPSGHAAPRHSNRH
jgi:DNA mismatch endonuclease (patch repair protein)